jgi:predicted HTH transcriptional regulator
MLDGTYVRVSGTTRHVEEYMLKELILEGQNRYFDSEVCVGLNVTADDIEHLCKSMKETALKNTWNDSEKSMVKDVTPNVLLSWGVLKEVNGKILPTNAYALLTGKMPMHPVVQCGIFKGIDRAYFIDRREFEGSIQEQVDVAFHYVLEKINMGMKINGIYRQDVYELPPDSIREMIANAVAHRSYLEQGNIQVALFDDRLEVTSPGMLINNVSISKMIEGYSKLRNPAIARAFAYMKIIEKWGTGIPRIFRECKEYGLPEPKLIDFDGDFRINIYRNKNTDTEKPITDIETNTEKWKTDIETNIENNNTDKETINKLIELIKNNPTITIKQMSERLDISLSGVRYHINKMKKNGMLEHIGPSKKGTWVINKV